MPQGTAFGMGAHCWLPLRDWRAGVRHCLRRAAASVSKRHPFFLLRAERGLAGPSPIRFSPTPSPSVNSPATHQRGIPVARQLIAVERTVVERTTELSDEVLKSLEAAQRAAIEAAGRFLVTVEEALPQEVEGTSDVAKKITESGLDTADRLVHTWYDVLRKVIGSAGKSLSGSNGAKPSAAK
jgi:hypothetical protein